MARKVLIYGGSGGIGSATARILRARGFVLHLVGRQQDRPARLAEADILEDFRLGLVRGHVDTEQPCPHLWNPQGNTMTQLP